jgi:hypothetical protein
MYPYHPHGGSSMPQGMLQQGMLQQGMLPQLGMQWALSPSSYSSEVSYRKHLCCRLLIAVHSVQLREQGKRTAQRRTAQ